MGTPLFGKYVLEKLSKIVNIKLVLCQPDKPSGRNKKIEIGEVKKYSIENNLRILQPDKIKGNISIIEEIKKIKPDFIFVAAYGKILNKEVLDLPKFGSINVHSSLLPKYRGAAPVNWSIINGDKTTGVTIMKMDEGMDTGDIILSKKLDISAYDNVETLTEKLAIVGSNLIEIFINNFKNKGNEFESFPQNDAESSTAPKMSKDISKINWEKDSNIINNLIRGSYPWPGANCVDSNNQLINIWEANSNDKILGEPGEIKKEDNKMFVCCGQGSIEILKIQKSGRKIMSGINFLNGIKIGEYKFS
tara:strand:+ start:32590 stop:33504 length:915 start_codon:yes stop_codon:yes gene_type:complete